MTTEEAFAERARLQRKFGVQFRWQEDLRRMAFVAVVGKLWISVYIDAGLRRDAWAFRIYDPDATVSNNMLSALAMYSHDSPWSPDDLYDTPDDALVRALHCIAEARANQRPGWDKLRRAIADAEAACDAAAAAMASLESTATTTTA